MKLAGKLILCAALTSFAGFFYSCDKVVTQGPDPDPQSSTAVTLLEPNGDESYSIGDTIRIKWETDDTVVISILSVQISLDGGKTFSDPVTSSYVTDTQKWENHPWVITDEISIKINNQSARIPPVSDSCIIRIYDYNKPTVTDKSDAYFSIKE